MKLFASTIAAPGRGVGTESTNIDVGHSAFRDAHAFAMEPHFTRLTVGMLAYECAHCCPITYHCNIKVFLWAPLRLQTQRTPWLSVP